MWAGALAGFVFTRRRWLAAACASAPLSLLMFGALGVIPLSGRLALWMAPSLFAGVALLADAAARVAAG